MAESVACFPMFIIRALLKYQIVNTEFKFKQGEKFPTCKHGADLFSLDRFSNIQSVIYFNLSLTRDRYLRAFYNYTRSAFKFS